MRKKVSEVINGTMRFLLLGTSREGKLDQFTFLHNRKYGRTAELIRLGRGANRLKYEGGSRSGLFNAGHFPLPEAAGSRHGAPPPAARRAAAGCLCCPCCPCLDDSAAH